MGDLSVLVFIISLVVLPIGLIRPAWIVRREGVSRKKFGFWTCVIILVSLILAGLTLPRDEQSGAIQGLSSTTVPSTYTPNPVATPSSPGSPMPSTTADTKTFQAPQSDLSNDNYYTNSGGNKVHSPAFSNTIPVGATALCRDGTYSFSQSRRGTCSHHDGVEQWL